MTASTVTCLCRRPVAAGANYCVACGREVRQRCPVCFDERRLIAARDGRESPWCEPHGELLSACSRCGRWFAADIRQCPDPACRGSVGPTWPVTTGASPDGTGTAGTWRWPAAWDRDNPRYTLPAVTSWAGNGQVHSALIAHGRLYVWVETSLISPSGPAGGPLTAAEDTGAGTPWSCWLGHDGQANARIAAGTRVAVVGGAAVLAAANGFLLACLYPGRTDDVVPLSIGTPIAQGSSDGWWVGWCLAGSAPALWIAPVPANWRSLSPEQVIEAPPDSAPGDNARLTIVGDLAHWIAQDGAIWQLDCRCRALRQVKPPMAGVHRIWCDAAGPHPVRSAGDGLRVSLGAGTPGGAEMITLRDVACGVGPLRDVFASPELVAVAGRTVIALDSRSGNAIGEGRYTGRWIAGALAEPAADALDREPRLLMLTDDAGDGSLLALHPASGVVDVVWRESRVRPLGLIPAGESLYVVHEGGVARLQETQR